MSETALDSAGSAAKENERTVNSLQGRLNALMSSWQAFANSFMSSDFLKGAVSAATGFLDIITKIIDSVGTLPTLLGLAFGALRFTDFKEFTPTNLLKKARDIDGGKNTFIHSKSYKDNISLDTKLITEYSNALREGRRGTQELSMIMAQGSNVAKEYASSMTKVGEEARGDNDESILKNLTEDFDEFSKSSDISLQAQDRSFKNVNTLIGEYNKKLKAGGDAAKNFAKDCAKGNETLGLYFSSLKDGDASLSGYLKTLGGFNLKSIGKMMLGSLVDMGITVAVTALVTQAAKLIRTSKEIEEAVNGAISAYDEQHDKLVKNKSDFNELTKVYSKYKDGVNQLNNENISLTADEYEEYLSAVNSIADISPTLVSHYDAQGNAILDCAGNVGKLTEAYNDLIIAENEALLNGDGEDYKGISDVIKNLKSDYRKLQDRAFGGIGLNTDDVEVLEKIATTQGKIEETREILDEVQRNTQSNDVRISRVDAYPTNIDSAVKANKASIINMSNAIKKEVEAQGIEIAGVPTPTVTSDYDVHADYIAKVKSDYPEIIQSVLEVYDEELDAQTSEMRTIMDAYAENQVLKKNYKNIDSDMQDVMSSIISGMNPEAVVDLAMKGEDAVYEFVDGVLGSLNSLNAADTQKFKDAFNLETELNSGELTWNEYLNEVKNVEKIIDSMNISDEIKTDLKVSLGIKTESGAAGKLKQEYNALCKDLVSSVVDESGKQVLTFDMANDILSGMTKVSATAIVDLATSGNIDTKVIKEFADVVQRAKDAGLTDLNRTQFGNVDLGIDRGSIEWTTDALSKYSEALASWGYTQDQINTMAGTTSSAFGKVLEKEGMKIAVSPMLETEDGMTVLSKDTVNKYVDEIISKAKEDDGKFDAKELLSFDMTGLEIDGQKISNIFASVGNGAEKLAEQLQYAGEHGLINETEFMRLVDWQEAVENAKAYEIDIEAETAGIEAVNTALAETASATGLTAESISKLKDRYAGLEASGMNLANMFEETALGVRLNTDAFNEFETALTTQKIDENKGHLETLKIKYEELQAVMRDTSASSAAKSAAMAEIGVIEAKMKALSTEASMYEGLVNAYAQWQNAEAAGTNRDMYETVLGAHKNIKDELERGWADDATIKYLELMTGKTDLASKSVQDLRTEFSNLDKAIPNSSSGYSVNDWFTVDSDGNSTSEGVWNFLDTINGVAGEIGDAVTVDENGNYTFDFSVAGGDKAIAEALGVSEELVQIMVSAAKDAGFEVNFEGAYEQFNEIISSAEKAQVRFNELTGKEYSFNFKSSDVEELASDFATARGLLDKYYKDGVLDTSTDEAKAALEMASTLQTAMDRLSDPNYIGVDAAEYGDFEEPVKHLQEYDKLLAEKHQLELQGANEADKTSELGKAWEENAKALDDVFKKFQDIRDAEDKTLADALGITDMSDDQLREALDGQTFTIQDAELKITAKIDDTLQKLLDLELLDRGIKKEYEIPWLFADKNGGAKTDGIDFKKYTEDEAKIIESLVKGQAGVTKAALDELGTKERGIAVDFYMANKDDAWFNELVEGQKNFALKFVAENDALLTELGLDETQKDYVVNFVAKNPGFIRELTDDQKKIACQLVAENPEIFDGMDDTKKKVAIEYIESDPEFFDTFSDPIEQKIIIDYINAYGIDKWNAITDKEAWVEEQKVNVTAGEVNTEGLEGEVKQEAQESANNATSEPVEAEQPVVLKYDLNNDGKESLVEGAFGWVADHLNPEGKQTPVVEVEPDVRVSDSQIAAGEKIWNWGINLFNKVFSGEDAPKPVVEVEPEVSVKEKPKTLEGTFYEFWTGLLPKSVTEPIQQEVEVEPDVRLAASDSYMEAAKGMGGLLDDLFGAETAYAAEVEVTPEINVENPEPVEVAQQVDVNADVNGENVNVDGAVSVEDPAPKQVDQEVKVNPVARLIQSIGSAIAGLFGSGQTTETTTTATVGVTPVPTTTDIGSQLTGEAMVSPSPTTLDLGSNFTGSGTIDVSPKTRDLGYFTGSGTINLTPNPTSLSVTVTGVAVADGTAHANGTAGSGRAFANGNWGVNGSGTALGGELGTEVVVRNGRYFTIGENGAEFFDYQRGDIIFNHKQTEELFKNGRVTSGGGRGKAFANGSFPSSGRAFNGEYGSSGGSSGGRPTYESSSSVSSYSSSKSSSSSSDASKEAEDFKEKLDWIEIAIDRVERAISRLDLKASSVFNNWSKRNSALASQISKVSEEIDLQERGAQRYLEEANSVGLSEDWAQKVRDGKVDIETITDEDLKEKIDEYQQWYEKYLDCTDAAEELKETERELYVQRFENIQTEYDGIISLIEAEKNLLEEYVNQSEANGWLVSAEYYRALATSEQKNLDTLRAEESALLAEYNDIMASGNIDETSEQWVELCNSINETTLAIAESETQLLEYKQTLQQLDWEVFDMIQDRISKITDESEFLIDLLSSDKLYNEDNGQLTDAGMTTMGLHGVNYNVAMARADKYAEEIDKIAKELEKDPHDTELQERYWELVDAQQEAIKSAKGYKEAIRDMVEEGIQLELDALQELIDKRNEALDAEKDAYEYQKKVKEQTEEIAQLEKQMAAYRNDNSEEVRAKVQELKISLEEAKEELEETEYDKYISDQEKLMDDLYLEYETILNERLDNLELLITDMTAEINANSSSIADTLNEKAESVGYDLSQSMSTIWDTSSGKIVGASGEVKNVITTYGDNFLSKLTTTNASLSDISTNIASMIGQLNKIAGTKVKSAQQTAADKAAEEARKAAEEKKKNESKPPQNNTTEKSISVGGKINAGNATIYATSNGTGGGSQYYKNDPIYTVLSEQNGYLLVRHHKLSSGYTGWFKKSDVKGYATGKKNFLNDEVAWTQEAGQEFIIRPSDGAILTPLAKNDSVLSAAASNNLWNMANSPADFIRENLGLGISDSVAGQSAQTSISQNFEQIVFNMPNVKNYEQMLSAMSRDKNFERLINAMTVDQLAGKSSLSKGKAIR